MYKIYTKNKEYTGTLAGITIYNGEGQAEELKPEDIDWLQSYGHTVEEVEDSKKNKK